MKMESCPATFKNKVSNLVEKYTTDLANLTSVCCEWVEAFDGYKQRAREYEKYFAQGCQRQPQTEASLAEFQKHFNDYQRIWAQGALDPEVLSANFLDLKRREVQFRDELMILLKEWKSEQALAQIGKQLDTTALDLLAKGFAKLDNTIYGTCCLISRFQEFAEERLQRSALTQMIPFWQGVLHKGAELATRLEYLRIELQRESFLVYQQPPYIVRLSSGKASCKESKEEEASDGSADGTSQDSTTNAQEETTKTKKCPKSMSQSKGDEKNKTTEGGGPREDSENGSKQQEKKVKFDLRVRLMVGDKGLGNGNTKVCAFLLTDHQCKELTNKQLSIYENPLATLAAIGPPASNGKGPSSPKRKVAKGRRHSYTTTGLSFTAGQLTPCEARLSYGSNKDQFEAFFQRVKVNEKDRNPEADAQSRFYRILFVTKLKDRQSNDVYLWCVSLPFPIVVNATRQERATSAKIFCHLALATSADTVIDRHQSISPTGTEPSTSPSSLRRPSAGSASNEQRSMKWKYFFQLLCYWWTQQIEQQKDPQMGSLRPHEPYLASKLQVDKDNPEAMISLAGLIKINKADGLDFSFWDWLFSIAEFVKKKENKQFWNKGFIAGFVSKDEVNAYLDTIEDEPVMLIRFSDSFLGGIVISFGMKGKPSVPLLLRRNDEQKKYPLPMFVQKCKQLMPINRIVANVLVPGAFKPKSELLRLATNVESQPNDRKVQKGGYILPKLQLDIDESPLPLDFTPSAMPGAVEEDDESLEDAISVEELNQLLDTSGFFDNGTDGFCFDPLSAHPYNFSTALMVNQLPAAVFPIQENACYEKPMWNGDTHAEMVPGMVDTTVMSAYTNEITML